MIILLVATVAAAGISNYATVREYESRGVAVTGFSDDLAASMVVAGTMLYHAGQQPDASSHVAAVVLLANAAMGGRNVGYPSCSHC